MGDQWTHLDETGASRMVDVGDKTPTRRSATAEARLRMQSRTSGMIERVEMAKGDVLPVARLAGMMAAKQTDRLIPLCHSVPLDSVEVQFDFVSDTVLLVRATANCTGKTGVEMEALSAATVAALTVYDMCKAVDREMSIEHIVLTDKSGGRSGTFRRTAKDD